MILIKMAITIMIILLKIKIITEKITIRTIKIIVLSKPLILLSVIVIPKRKIRMIQNYKKESNERRTVSYGNDSYSHQSQNDNI